MERYNTSLPENSTAVHTKNSITKLHDSVSQALSHPTEQTLEQAGNSLEHAEQAVRQAGQSLDAQAVALDEEMLEDEKLRLASLKGQGTPEER